MQKKIRTILDLQGVEIPDQAVEELVVLMDEAYDIGHSDGCAQVSDE